MFRLKLKDVKARCVQWREHKYSRRAWRDEAMGRQLAWSLFLGKIYAKSIIIEKDHILNHI